MALCKINQQRKCEKNEYTRPEYRLEFHSHNVNKIPGAFPWPALIYSEGAMDCAECDRLLAEYERLEQAYATAVNVLNSSAETANVSEYMRLRAAADEARLDSEVARLQLEQHKRVHSMAN